MAAGDEVSGRDGQMGDDGKTSVPTQRTCFSSGGVLEGGGMFQFGRKRVAISERDQISMKENETDTKTESETETDSMTESETDSKTESETDSKTESKMSFKLQYWLKSILFQ